MAENGRRRLTSWKEIASHMGRDVRTVLRWEKQRGLPVHRAPGATGRVVSAYTDELDAWARGAGPDRPDDPGSTAVTPLVPTSESPLEDLSPDGRPWWRAAVLSATAVLVLAAGAWWMASGAGGGATAQIANALVTETAVQATRADGGVLWTYALGGAHDSQSSRAVVTDLNGDGLADVAASLAGGSKGDYQGILLALDHRGRKLWDHKAQDALTFGKEPFGPPWAADELARYSVAGRPLVAWALHHHTWWPSLVAVFNGQGERTATFVHSGWIRNVVPSRDGKYLLAGGISNARNGAAFALLDPAQPGGTSPEDAGSVYDCRTCPNGAPLRYFVIPWTDVIEPIILGGRRGQPVSFPDGRIELRAVQSQNAEIIVELTPSLEIRRRRISDGYWLVHAQRERDGLLKHSREGCPFKDGPSVFEWMPEHGWRELKP